jgi:hypothetical protein
MGFRSSESNVGTGADLRFTPRVHQQALATGPFSSTYEADAVLLEATKRGVAGQKRLQPGDSKWIHHKNNTTFIYHLLASSIMHSYRSDIT